MRKRQNNISSGKTTRPDWPLTDDEIDEIRQAYHEGCKGEILIGMRGEERVITLLLPTHAEETLVLQRVIAKLKALGCDRGYRLKRRNATTKHYATPR